MFGKLLKHEFRLTGRIMIPVYAAAVLCAVMSCITTAVLEYVGSIGGIDTIVRDLIYGITTLTIVGALMAGPIFTVVRFYKMLGDDGYLTFSLPVRPFQHVLCRLLTGVSWLMLGLVLLITGVAIEGMVFRGENLFQELFGIGIEDRALAGVKLTVMLNLALMVLSSVISGFATVFLACTLGAQMKMNRLGATFLVSMLEAFIWQLLSMLVMLMCGNWLIHNEGLGWFMTGLLVLPEDSIRMFSIFMWIVSGVALLKAVAYLLVVRYFVTNRLNLR